MERVLVHALETTRTKSEEIKIERMKKREENDERDSQTRSQLARQPRITLL